MDSLREAEEETVHASGHDEVMVDRSDEVHPDPGPNIHRTNGPTEDETSSQASESDMEDEQDIMDVEEVATVRNESPEPSESAWDRPDNIEERGFGSDGMCLPFFYRADDYNDRPDNWDFAVAVEFINSIDTNERSASWPSSAYDSENAGEQGHAGSEKMDTNGADEPKITGPETNSPGLSTNTPAIDCVPVDAIKQDILLEDYWAFISKTPEELLENQNSPLDLGMIQRVEDLWEGEIHRLHSNLPKFREHMHHLSKEDSDSLSEIIDRFAKLTLFERPPSCYGKLTLQDLPFLRDTAGSISIAQNNVSDALKAAKQAQRRRYLARIAKKPYLLEPYEDDKSLRSAIVRRQSASHVGVVQKEPLPPLTDFLTIPLPPHDSEYLTLFWKVELEQQIVEYDNFPFPAARHNRATRPRQGVFRRR